MVLVAFHTDSRAALNPDVITERAKSIPGGGVDQSAGRGAQSCILVASVKTAFVEGTPRSADVSLAAEVGATCRTLVVTVTEDPVTVRTAPSPDVDAGSMSTGFSAG